MAKCPACKANTLKKTDERFESTGHEQAVWKCSACNHGEGRATGQKAPKGLTSELEPRPSKLIRTKKKVAKKKASR